MPIHALDLVRVVGVLHHLLPLLPHCLRQGLQVGAAGVAPGARGQFHRAGEAVGVAQDLLQVALVHPRPLFRADVGGQQEEGQRGLKGEAAEVVAGEMGAPHVRLGGHQDVGAGLGAGQHLQEFAEFLPAAQDSRLRLVQDEEEAGGEGGGQGRRGGDGVGGGGPARWRWPAGRRRRHGRGSGPRRPPAPPSGGRRASGPLLWPVRSCPRRSRPG